MHRCDFMTHVLVSGPYFSEGHWKEVVVPKRK